MKSSTKNENNGVMQSGGDIGYVSIASGTKSKIKNMIINSGDNKDEVNLNELAQELEILRLKLKEEAKTSENDIVIGHIAEAESYARKEDRTKAYKSLKKAGGWALDVAKDIGVPIATKVLEKLLGF